MPAVNGDTVLTAAQRRALTGPPLSNQFTPDDLLYRDYADFKAVYEWPGDLDLRGVREMLSKDGNPRKLEQVLTLPIRGAAHEIQGSGPAIGLVRDNLGPLLGDLIDQSTSAIAYRKAFFEITWALNGGQIVYEEIASRPAVACEAAYREDTGRPDGFRQQLAPITVLTRDSATMGWVRIEKPRAFIYTHGTHREPLRGISDLDVSLYCWDNIRKLQFLWFQFLEQQSLPKVGVYGDDRSQAERNAANWAKAKASAAVPLERPSEPNAKVVEVVESSGRGADQFAAAIAYLENKQTQSVLASFTDLASSAASGKGSFALSADQSEFFLASRQAMADELAKQITEGVIRPLVVYNYGPDAEVPTLRIGPIGNRQTDRALGMLQTLITSPTVNAPDDFTGFLINHTASFLGLDADKVAEAVERWELDRAERAEEMRAQMQQGETPAEAPAETAVAEEMARAVGVATELVRRARDGEDPDDVLASLEATP